jgi:HAD superfamily phosphoserine phosphatase-like hydrolase
MIKKFKENQAEIIVVTASAENWVAPWCQELGIGCIATQLEIKDDLLTGKIKGRNCHGIEKVNRLKEVIDLSKYTDIEAFGDSKGDLPMLKLATRAYYKPFRD